MSRLVIPQVDTLQEVIDLQNFMAEQPNQIEFPVRHTFAPGLYSREMFMDADTACAGFRHRQPHLFMLMFGEITIVANGEPRRVQAPYVYASPVGEKRVIYAHIPSAIQTVHATDLTDVSEIERWAIMPDNEELTIEGEVL